MKKTICAIIIILIIAFIWGNSYQSKSDTTHFSMFFTTHIQILLIKIGLHPNLDIMNTYVRKLAHLTEFMALGAIIYYTFKQFFKTHIGKGRTSSGIDVLIDTTGSIIGILIIKGLLKLKLH